MGNLKNNFIRYILIFVVIIFSTNSVLAQCGPLTSDDTDVCDNTTLRAPNPAPNTGLWTTTGNANIVSPNNRNTVIDNLDFGPNTFIWTVAADNCEDSIVVQGIKIPVFAGNDQPNACASTTLTGSNPSPGTGLWTCSSPQVVFDDNTSPTADVSNLPVGDITFIWTVTYKGCDNSDTMVVTNNTPQPVHAGSDNEACSGDSIQLNGTVPGANNGEWTVIGGTGTFTNSNLNDTWVSGLAPNSINVYRWRVFNAFCENSDTVEITNNSIDLQDFTLADTVCTDAGNISVTCPSPTTYNAGSWKIVASSGSITNPGNCNTPVTDLNFDANTFRYVATKGTCKDSIEVTIIAHAVIANVSSDVAQACEDSVNLYVNDPSVFGGVGSWSVTGGSGTVNNINSPTTYATGLSKSAQNVFTWVVTKGSCSATDSVIVDYNEPDIAVISNGDTGVTCNNAYVINAVAPTSGSGYWTSGTAGVTYTPNNNAASVSVDNLALGNNTFVWHVTNGTCPEKTDTILIINQFPPNVDAGGPYDTVCNGESINLSGSLPPPGGTGLWTAPLPNSFDDPTLNTAEVSNIPYGPSILTWTVTVDMCSASDQVTIYSNRADPAIAQADFNICGTNAHITAAPVTNGIGTWSSDDIAIVIDNPNSDATDVHNLSSGGNTFYWTVINGACTVEDTLIVYNDSVSVANANTDQYICIDSAQLLANTPVLGNGHWTLASGGANFEDANKPDTWVTNLARGENIFIWQITGGASCSSEDTVSIFNLSVDAQIVLADPYPVCADSSVIIANNPNSQDINPPDYLAGGVWNVLAGPANIPSISSYQAMVYNLPIDTTLLVWTMNNGYCSDKDTLAIVNNSPTTALAGRDTVVCGQDLTNLTGNQPLRGVGHWEVVAGIATFDNSTLYNTAVHDLDYWCFDDTPEWWLQENTTNDLLWIIEYEGCISHDTVSIINAQPSYINAGPDQVACANTANLNADHAGCAMEHWWTAFPASSVEYHDPVTGVVDNTDFNSHLISLQNGVTSFVWHKRNTVNGIQCEVTDTTQVNALGYVEDVSAGMNDAFCDSTYKLNADPASSVFGGTNDTWGFWEVTTYAGRNNRIWFENSTLQNTNVHLLGHGTNILRWTIVDDTYNCIMTDDVYLVNALPSLAQTADDTIVCEDRALLTANRPVRGIGEWFVVGGGSTVVNPTCQNYDCYAYAENLGPGTNTFKWLVTNTYNGPHGNFTVANPKVCRDSDFLVIENREIVADAGNTIYICADIAQLNANLETGQNGQWNVAGGSGFFVSTGGNTSTLYNDVVTNLTRGKNTFTWTVSNGTCYDSDELIVWDNLPNPNPNAGFDQTICADSTTLAANSITRNNVWYDNTMTDTLQWGYSTQGWTVWGTGTIDDPTSTNTWVRNIPLQTQTAFIWNAYYHFTDIENNISQVCLLRDSVEIFNNSVNAVAGSEPAIVCGIEGPGAQYQLGATQVTAPLTGFWNPVFNPGPSNIVTPSAYNSWVTGMQNGDHIYQWNVQVTRNTVTCSASDTVVVRVRIPTTSTVALPDSFDVCVNSAPLQANAAVWGNGTWIDVYGGMGTITNPISNNTTVTALWPGKSKWAWVIDNDGCTSSDTITVINNTITADADDRIADPNIQNICVDTFALSATDPNIFNFAPPIATANWTGVPGSIYFDNSTVYNTVVHGLSNTQPNILRWTITKDNCVKVSQLVINNNFFTIDADVSSANNLMSTCADTIQLAGQQPTGTGTGTWNLFTGGGMVIQPTVYNSIVRNLKADSNYLEWTVVRDGCIAKDTVIVTNNQIFSQAGVDDTVCYDTTSLAAGLPLLPATGTWTSIVGGGSVDFPNDNNSHVSSMGSNQNQFVWTVTKGACTAKDTVNIVNNAPDPAIVEADRKVCDPTTTLTVTVPPADGIGQWSLVTGSGNILNPNALIATVQNLGIGKNTLIWTVTKGNCESVDSLNIINNQVDANAGLNDTVCIDTAQLFAVDPSTFFPNQGVGVWTEEGGNGIITNSTLNNTSVTNLGPNTNRFRWTVTHDNCSKSADVLILNRTVVATASSFERCNFPVNLTGTPPGTNDGLWKNIGGQGSVNDSTLFNSSYDGLDKGLTNTLRWIVSNSNCADSVSITVTNSSFVLSAGLPQTLCKDFTDLDADDAGSGIGTWSVDAGSASFSGVNDPKASVTLLAKGKNVLRWTVTKDGCTNTATVTIVNNSPSEALILGLDTVYSCYDTITLNAKESTPFYFTSRSWQQISGGGMVGNPSTFSYKVNGLAPGNNVFAWVVNNGACSSSDTVVITNNQVVSEAGNADTVCADSTNLNAVDPLVVFPYQGVGTWSNLSGPQSDIDNSTLLNTQVNNLKPGTSTFEWTVSLGTCNASDNVQITNRGITAVAFDESDCDGDIQLNGNKPPAGGYGLWTIVSGSGSIPDSTLNSTSIVGVTSGSTSTLQWRITNGVCPDSVLITVSNNGFIVNAGGNDTICVDTIQLNGQIAGTAVGTWSIFSGSGNISTPSDRQAIVRNLGVGDNVLQWQVVDNGCTNNGYVTIVNNSVSEALITGPSNTEVCNNLTSLTAQPVGEGLGHWEQISGTGMTGQPTTNPVTVNGLAPNGNIFAWVVEKGKCVDSDIITIYNNYVEADAGLADTSCVDSIQLNAVDPALSMYGGSGQWQNLSGSGDIRDINNPKSYIANLPRYTGITLRWHVTKGINCSADANVNIINYSIVATAGDIVACDSFETLIANPYSTPLENGYWSIGAPNSATFVDNPSNNICDVDNLSPGSNKFTWHLRNAACNDSTTIFVSNNSFDVNADATGNSVAWCSDTYKLSGDNPGTGTGVWTVLSGPGQVVNSTLYSSYVTNLSPIATLLQWEVTRDGCTKSDQVSIVNGSTIASASPHLTTCDGDVTLYGNNPGTGSGVWKKVVSSASGQIVNSTLYNTQILNIDKSTSVALRWVVTSPSGCLDSVKILVTNNDFDLSAGLNDTICSDTLELFADSPGTGTGVWSVLNGSGVFEESTNNNTIVRNVGTGDNIYTWTVTKNGCPVSANDTVTNNSVSVFAGLDQLNLCDDFATLSGSAGNGVWTLVSGAGVPTISTNNVTIVTGLSRNDNAFRWTVTANGCSNYDDVILRNNDFDVNAGLPIVICADTAQLDAVAVAGGVGTWTPQGGTPAYAVDIHLNTSVVRDLQQGANTMRWTVVKDGCTNYEEVIITNDLPDPPALISVNDTVCVDSARLQAVMAGIGVGTWTYTGSGGDILAIHNNDTWAKNLNLGNTEFTWTVKNNACELSESFIITNDFVSSNAGGDQKKLCVDYTSLNSVNPTTPAQGWWTKADAQPNNIDDSRSNVTDVTNLGYGENKFVWNVKKGRCEATDTVIIINNAAAPAEVGNVPPTCLATANLSATPPVPGIGVWSYTGTYAVVIDESTNTNTFVSNLEYGANLFTWTVNNTTPYTTCSDDTSFVVVNNHFVITAGNTQILCDSTTNLEGETRPYQDSAKWEIVTGSPNILNSTDANTIIYISEGQSSVLRWTVYENGCFDDELVTIQNQGVTPIAFDDEVCTPNATLNAIPASGLNHGYWTSSTPTIVYTPDNSANNASVTGLKEGANLFTWHLKSPNCSDSTTINVNYLVPDVDAGPSIPICKDEHVLSAYNPAPDGATGVWSLVSGAGNFVNSTYFKTNVTDIGQGPNVYRWTVTLRGCSNSRDVTITNNKPTISVGVTQNICNSTTKLTGNNLDAGDVGSWIAITSGPETIDNSTLNNTDVFGMIPGTYIFEWTVSDTAANCSATEQLIVNNNSVVADAGSPIVSCVDSVRLAASLPPNTTGYWTTPVPGPVIQDSTLFNTWVTDLNADNNLFTWHINSNGCDDDDFVIVTNNSVIVEAGDIQDICSNTTTLFGSNTSGGTGVWRRVSGSGYFLDSTTNVTTVYDLGQGANVFSWSVLRGLCPGEDQVVINNNEVFADAGSGDNSLCATEFNISAIPAGVGETGAWSITGGAGSIDQSTDYSTWVRNLARGENVLRWTVSSLSTPCDNYDEIKVINITPSRAVTAPDKEICYDYTSITANDPYYGQGAWVKVTGTSTIEIENSTLNSTNVINLGKGPNMFAWIITDAVSGCSTSDTIEVTNSSTTAFAGLEKEICVDSFKLEASNPSTGIGTWTKVSPYGTFDNSTVHNTYVKNIGMGSNTFRWTVKVGKCSASAEVIIINNTPTTAFAGDDQISCDGTVTLVGNTPDLDETGLWFNISGSANIDNDTRYWTAVDSLSYGENRFTWRIDRGQCYKIDTIVVNNNKINVFAGSPQEVCSDSAFLTGNIPTYGSGKWYLSGGAGVFDNSTNYETAVTGIAPGVNTYKWVISDSPCSAYDEVQVTNNEPTNAIVCKDTIKTCNDYVNLCANLPPDGEIGYWKLFSGSGIIDDSTDPSTLVSQLGSVSSFTWTIKKGNCPKSDTVFIRNGTVEAIVSTDTLEVCGTSGTLSANNPIDTNAIGTWQLISGTGIIDESTNFITDVDGLSEGANTFRWTVELDNCSASDDMVLLNNLLPVTANMAGTNPICSPEVWVLGNSPSTGAYGLWSFSAGVGQFDDNTSPATRAYDINPGENTARWTIYKGSCENFAEFDIVNRTIVAQANSPIIVCDFTDTTSIVADDPNPGTGEWTLLSGTVDVINSTLYSTLITGVGPGSNSLKWRVDNSSCSDSVNVVVQNNRFTVSAGTDRTVCDTSTVLSATNPGTTGSGIWTVSGGSGTFDNSTLYTTRVNGLLQGDNTYTWSVAKNGCSASANVVIVNGLPYAQGGGDRTSCADSIKLSASNPTLGSGTWSLTGGSGFIVEPTLYNSMVRNLGHGQNTFRWTVTNGSCQVHDAITVYNYAILQTAGDDQEVCDTFTSLAADPPGANGTGYWTVAGGGGTFENNTEFNTKVYGLYDGANTFVWHINENGCSASSNVQIVNNRFDVNAGIDQVVPVGNTTMSAVVIGGTVGTWSVAGGAGSFGDPHAANSAVNNLQYGINTYSWTVYNPVTGCTAFDQVDVIYNGFTVEAGNTQYICADSSTLDATDVFNATTYWTIDLGSCTFDNITSAKTKIYNVARGQSIFRWNVSKNGFTTSDTVSVYNYNFDVDAGQDKHLCDDNSQLTGTGPTNTTWANNWSGSWIILHGGGNFSNQNDPNATVSFLAGDTNKIQWSVTRTVYPGGGVCRSIDTVSLIYYEMPNTDFVFADGIGQGCSPLNETFINTTPTADTIAGTMYRWNFANQGERYVNWSTQVSHTFNNFSSTNDTTFTVSLVAQVMVNSGIICTDTVTHDVVVWAIPNADLLASPVTSEYPNSFINIENRSSTNGTTYSWNWGDTQGLVEHSFVPNHSHFYNSWGDYTISLVVWNANNCHDSTWQDIHIIAPEPISGANNNIEGCTPLEMQLYGNVSYTTSGTSQYRWIVLKDGTDDTVVTFNSLNPIFTFRDEGIYFAKFWATAQGSNPAWSYTYIRTDTIIVYPVPVANFNVAPTEVMAPEQPIHCYDSSENAVRYLWDFGLDNHTAVSNEHEPIYFYKEPGNYIISLQVWTSHGCTDKKYLELPIKVLGSGDIRFPNAFSPVSPIEKNTVFKPAVMEGVDEYHLQIFNRWGEMIFESKDATIGWNGYVNNILAPQDVYVYKCRVQYTNGFVDVKTGSVTLLR